MVDDCCIWNRGGGSWLFDEIALHLSRALGISVSTEPRLFNYLLGFESTQPRPKEQLFVPWDSIQLTLDKRSLARVFVDHSVPSPESHVLASLDGCRQLADSRPEKSWCLKFPTGCGGSGHRLLTQEMTLPDDWPRPFLLQEFIRLERPEVYRTYAAGGELFGWVIRRYPSDVAGPISPWVAHARGARYEVLDEAPEAAKQAATLAFQATGLLDSFACADLLQTPSGQWLVLEVGTDGIMFHVDRDLGHPAFETEITKRIKTAFWKAVESQAR